MSLPYAVLRFIERVRRKPVLGTDPDELKSLERRALDSFDGANVALHAPNAPDTWEARAILLGNTVDSELVPMRFPRRLQVVGMLPTLVQLTTASAAARKPTLDDVDVSMAIDSGKRNVTQAAGVSTPSGGRDGTFVTLSGLSILAPRLHGLTLDEVNPLVNWKFRWKLGPNVYQDSLITVIVMTRPLP